MQQLLVGTQNPGKQQEFKAMLSPVVDTLLFPDDVGLSALDPIENGKTYRENAAIKARAYAEAAGIPTVSGDSGFEVDAMDGDPGLHSNRWLSGSDEDRNAAILEILEDIEADDLAERGARFVSVLALVQPDALDEPLFFEGEITGSVAYQAVGDNGFAYDRIFIPRGYDLTYAQLGDEVKGENSHRAGAIQALQEYLKQD